MILVRAPCGAPRLWLERGELRDALGLVRVHGLDVYLASELELEEIAAFVATWVARAAERHGALAIDDVNPVWRSCVYAMASSAILTDDDVADDRLPS